MICECHTSGQYYKTFLDITNDTMTLINSDVIMAKKVL
jgi:hypothetical protein